MRCPRSRPGPEASCPFTSICIVDESGKIVRETRVASDPVAIVPIPTLPGIDCRRVGLEAGPLCQWLFSGLAEAGLPVICVETRRMKAALPNRNVQTDIARHIGPPLCIDCSFDATVAVLSPTCQTVPCRRDTP